MSRLTKEDLLKFPETSYGRMLGKQLASQVMNEILQYKQLEEQLGHSLEEAINLLFEGLKLTELYNCLTCTSVMHDERGCEGSCEHNKEFSKKEILEVLKRYVDYYNSLKKNGSE